MKPCGLDFALWIDISPKVSLDRFLGRRWVDENCFHLSEDITCPNELTVGEKASPIILKNDFKLNNKLKLENWLRLFGIKVKMEEGEYTQSCWETVSGEVEKYELNKEVCRILEKGMEIKRQRMIEIAA